MTTKKTAVKADDKKAVKAKSSPAKKPAKKAVAPKKTEAKTEKKAASPKTGATKVTFTLEATDDVRTVQNAVERIAKNGGKIEFYDYWQEEGNTTTARSYAGTFEVKSAKIAG